MLNILLSLRLHWSKDRQRHKEKFYRF